MGIIGTFLYLYLFFSPRKENTVLRAHVHHSRVSVIPNAVDTKVFKPDLALRSPNRSMFLTKLQTHLGR